MTWPDMSPGTPEVNGVTTAPDGAVWFVNAQPAGLGRLDPDDGGVTFTADPGAELSVALDVVVSGDGAVWYTAATAGVQDRVTPVT